MKPLSFCLAVIFSFLVLVSVSQIKFDSLPLSSGIAGLLISGPFTGPRDNQEIKIPAAYYKESGKEQVFMISSLGKIEKGVCCISKKKVFSYYANSKKKCDWWEPFNCIAHQGNKWSRVEQKVSLKFRQSFCDKLSKAEDLPCDFYLPDLSFHFFWFTRDSFPNFAAYDCIYGSEPVCVYMNIAKDGIEFMKPVCGYTYDLRISKNKLLVFTKWGSEQVSDFECHTVYEFFYRDGKVKQHDSCVIASAKGLKLPATYNTDKKFRLISEGTLLEDRSGVTDKDEKYPEGSFGYILAEEEGMYFVAMINNLPTSKKIFGNYVTSRMGNNVKNLYVLGWIKKVAVSFE